MAGPLRAGQSRGTAAIARSNSGGGGRFHGAPSEGSSACGPMSTASSASFTGEADEDSPERRKTLFMYLLFLVAYLSVQFGHGANIGYAVSLDTDGGRSKAMNLALGSWVMVGVCLGLPLTPWACRTWGVFQVCFVCVIIDLIVILLMLVPGISIVQIYLVRFLVGFFEAPFLPYLQEWLAKFGKHTWNVWNTVLHAMVPLGENLGYIVAQELVAEDFPWQWAFAGQAVLLAVSVALCYYYGGQRYLDLSYEKAQTFVDEQPGGVVVPSSSNGTPDHGGCESSPGADDHGDGGDPEVEYPVTERWVVYWAVNTSLAAQLGFLSGCKYVIRDFAVNKGFSIHVVIFSFSAIALVGPALGGTIAMSGSVIRPDQWSQHKKTLGFLACTSSAAAVFAVLLPYSPEFLFWPLLMATFTAAGGVYPAAQGIINIALTATRVIEASVYQVQCNNIGFAMPLPYVIGKTMDSLGTDMAFKCVTALQVLAAAGFVFSVIAATFTEERSAWHRLAHRQPPRDSEGQTSDIELSQRSGTEHEQQRLIS
mmetsp:Transcript_56868/g.144180  ORF Transcript_56868/g.144180 Transcript_56868/m.144180 type:complete len:538 (+) Transcript_56868:21-1634(+)